MRSRFAISGSTEFSVALRKTAGAFLGNLAHGWAEPWDYNHEGQPQFEENLRLRREIAKSESVDVAHLAQSVGNWLEDCWGNTVHRYLAARPGCVAI